MSDRAISACLALAGPDEGEEYTRNHTWLWLFVLFVAVAVAAMLLGSITPALASGSTRSSLSSSDDDDGDSGGDDSNGDDSDDDGDTAHARDGEDDSDREAKTDDDSGDGSREPKTHDDSGDDSKDHSKNRTDGDSDQSQVDKTHTVKPPDVTHDTQGTVVRPTIKHPSKPDKTKPHRPTEVLPKPPLTNGAFPKPDVRPRVEAGILPTTGQTPWWAVHVGFSLIGLGLAGLFLARSVALASGQAPTPYRRKRYVARSKRRARGPP